MKRAKTGGTFAFGVVLGLAGATLDFYSGYQLTTQSGMMGSGQSWGVGLFLLGVVLAVTALVSLSPGSLRMKDLGALMVVYGVVMLFIGALMYLGYTATMEGATFSGVGMLAVGLLMVVNGALMSRSPMV